MGIDCMAFRRFKLAAMDRLVWFNFGICLAKRIAFCLFAAAGRGRLVWSMAGHDRYLEEGFARLSLFV